MGRTIAKVSDNTLKLQSIMENFHPGDELSFNNIEHDSGVKMNERGKQYLRTACKRAKIEYSSIRGVGIKLADPRTTMQILSHRLIKVDNSVKRADKSHKNLQEKFFSQLTIKEQKDRLYIGSVFGAIRAASNNAKLIYGKNIKKINFSVEIPIPKNQK